MVAAIAPRERGILFRRPMVEAILAGRKTQTRRPLKRAVDQVGELARAVHPDGSGRGWIAWWGAHDVSAWPGTPYTSMRARLVGAPHSSSEFLRCARMRGRSDVRCGDRIRLPPPDGRGGVITGHTGGLGWQVLFDDGGEGAVHPDECEYLPRESPGGEEERWQRER